MRMDHLVSDEERGRHLRSLLEDVLTNVPAKGIRRAIQRGQIVVNKSRVSSNHQLVPGDQISIHIQSTRKRHRDVEIPVVQEDDQYALINKPAGLSVGGGRAASVSDFLAHILQQSRADDALLLPRAVHRLDKPTSGLLLIAKTKSALIHLSKQFETRTVQKKYTAVVYGHIENEGKVEITLSEKTALTYYTPLKNISAQNGEYTFVELIPKTGRTHQLRKHMAYLGHPIIGDTKYGKNISANSKDLMLCATKLVFNHPQSSKVIQYEIGLPPCFDML